MDTASGIAIDLPVAVGVGGSSTVALVKVSMSMIGDLPSLITDEWLGAPRGGVERCGIGALVVDTLDDINFSLRK